VEATIAGKQTLFPSRRRRATGEQKGLARRRSTKALGLTAALGVLALVVLASLAIGSKSIPLSTTFDALTNYDKSSYDETIIRLLRVPRTEVGLLVGIALGLAGAVMQGVTRNPLADPGILGVNGGATLCIVLGIYTLGVHEITGYVWFGFLGAAGAGLIVYAVGSMGREGATPVKLAIAGAALAALLGSATTTVLLLDAQALEVFRFWAVGSLASSTSTVAQGIWPFVAVGAVGALLTGRALNTLALGDDVARALGMRVGRARAFSAVFVIVLCGAATAVAGPIAFVGLTIPHVARAITGPDYRWILPYSAVLAPILLLGADVLGRVIVSPSELQVGVVTAFVGAPVFVALVRFRRLAEI
jgi:iron-siderophore transport system permease protein